MWRHRLIPPDGAGDPTGTDLCRLRPVVTERLGKMRRLVRTVRKGGLWTAKLGWRPFKRGGTKDGCRPGPNIQPLDMSVGFCSKPPLERRNPADRFRALVVAVQSNLSRSPKAGVRADGWAVSLIGLLLVKTEYVPLLSSGAILDRKEVLQ